MSNEQKPQTDDEPNELENNPELKLGEAAVDPSELVDEFGDYDSLEDEHPEDEAAARAGATADAQSQTTPKERKAANMRLEARVESVVFAANKPLKAPEVLDLLGDPTLTEEDVQTTLDQLVEHYEERGGGFRLHYLKRLGYQFQTADAAASIMERMFASRPRPISRAALETLAIIAYRQPVTRAEVEFIRGVDAGSIFKTLLERDLIKCTGRKEIIGRPMLFGTTDDFLKVFNLSSVKDLPPLESFQPNREVMQGAMDRIDENAQGEDLVDVEQYIADNTASADTAGDDDLSFPDEVLGDTDQPAEHSRPPSTSAEPQQEVSFDGTDAHPEVALPIGPDLAEGGGELDQ